MGWLELVGQAAFWSDACRILIALYSGVIYLAVEAVPLIYEQHGFHEPEVEFLFVSIVVGYILGIALVPIQLRFRHSQQRKNGGGELAPESKLTGWGFFAGIAFPISLYLFAWLALPQIHWFASLVPLALFGCASHVLFIMISDYTVDSYGHLASSAVTGQSFARELMSAGLIIAGQDFYENVGYPQATTILAAFATILGVLPFVFSKYGPRIRERSAYSLEVRLYSASHVQRTSDFTRSSRSRKLRRKTPSVQSSSNPLAVDQLC